MRTRNNRIVFYLNDKELATLARKVKKAGRSREAFIRNAVADIQIKEAPPADLHKLIWEIRRVGNNIDQILMKDEYLLPRQWSYPILKKQNRRICWKLWKVRIARPL